MVIWIFLFQWLLSSVDDLWPLCLQPFGNILNLVPLAESVVKLNAVCMQCFKEAAYTKRLGAEQEVRTKISPSGRTRAVSHPHPVRRTETSRHLVFGFLRWRWSAELINITLCAERVTEVSWRVKRTTTRRERRRRRMWCQENSSIKAPHENSSPPFIYENNSSAVLHYCYHIDLTH